MLNFLDIEQWKKNYLSKGNAKWLIGQLVFGLIYIILFFFIANYKSYLEIKLVLAVFYVCIVVFYFFHKRASSLSLIPIFIYAFVIRIFYFLVNINDPASFIKWGNFENHEWLSVLSGKSYSFNFGFNHFPLFEVGIFLIEGIVVFLLYLLISRYKINKGYITLYLLNPFLIENLYSYWNPLYLWTLFILLSGVFIVSKNRILASLALFFSFLFYSISLLFTLTAIRNLKFNLVFFLVPFYFLMFQPMFVGYQAEKTLYSRWLQNLIHFLTSSYPGYEDYWVIFLLSLALTIIIVSAVNKNEWVYKIYLGLYIFICVYPDFFMEVSFLMIVLSVINRNLGIIFLSVFLYCKASFEGLGITVINDYFIYWQYGILLLFLALSFFPFMKRKNADT